MNAPALRGASIPPMSPETLDRVRRLEAELAKLPQVEIATDHVLHGGLYARTICVPAGVALTGAEIKLPTVLILSGDASVTIGDETLRLTGYHVLPAAAGRKQAFLAHADTMLTMLFPTDARTVEQAEREFTDEADRLMSRNGPNTVTITGE